MNREKNLATIREACVRANSDLMNPEDIKKGTVLRDKYDDYEVVAEGPIDKHGGVGHSHGYGPVSRFIALSSRHIHLADVLLAIGGKKLNYAFFVDQEGGFGTALAGQNPKLFSVLKGWNLRKNNLNEQSDECLEFLAGILKEV